jgi:hypothetical protein
MGAYGEQSQGQQQGQPGQQGQMTQQQGMYPEDYYYPGDTYRGMQPNDQAAQVRQALFNLEIPGLETDYGQWIPMFITLLDAAPRIPGIDGRDFRRISRRFKDMVARAHSQGRKRVTAATCQEILFELRLLVSRCDTPAMGMSGVGAMITSNVNQKQDIRMPQQPQAQGFWPWSKTRGQQP